MSVSCSHGCQSRWFSQIWDHACLTLVNSQLGSLDFPLLAAQRIGVVSLLLLLFLQDVSHDRFVYV